MSSTTPGRSAQNERELVLTRVFAAPRPLVFQCWTDSEHMKNWFGPRMFTNPTCQLDVRTGGTWRIVMRGPDGTEHVATGVYQEVIPNERLVFTNIAEDSNGARLLEGITTVTFEDHGAGTKLTLRTRMTGLVPAAPAMLDGMEAGWSQSLDRLTEELEAV